MTYTTLTYKGTEKALADWNISSWNRLAQNQGEDSFTFTIQTPMDGASIFPYGANVIIQINRAASRVNPNNPTLPASLADGGGPLTYAGGTQWFWGYCVDEDRSGDPGNEQFAYKFAGPLQFFFERLIFQKFQLTWNGAQQIVDWQSDVILGLSLTTLTGTGDTVKNSTATNLMSIAQQVKEICMYAQNDSAYQQSTNGLGWPAPAVSGQPANAQFSCDQLTSGIDGVNWDLLNTPSANCLIADYAGAPLSGQTSASTLPSGSYILRAPLDAANAITCLEALRRQLRWLGGIGSPVVWMDHSQTPPQLRIAPRNQLSIKTLALSGITVRNRIKKRSDLIPSAVHFKYKVNGTYLGQPYSVLVNDVAATVSGEQFEGIGQLGNLTSLGGGTISSQAQNTFMALGKTAAAQVQTLDLEGAKINAQSASITTVPLPLTAGNLSDPASGATAKNFWTQLFPELANVTNLAFFDAANFPATVHDAVTGAAISLATYANWLQKGQFFPWMPGAGSTPQQPSPGVAAKVKITAWFEHQEQAVLGSLAVPTSNFGRVEKNIVVTLANVATNSQPETLYSAASVAVGEPIPYGLAGYIYALESIPQYEGGVLVQETEISDVCPIGNALNITGGLAAWATMQACVQSVRYSDNGQTEITFGPAKHLGPAEFVARFRNTVGPRWFNLIGGDPMNASSGSGYAAESTNGQQQASSQGGKDGIFHSYFSALDNILTNGGTPPTLPGGIHIDSGATGYPQGFVGGAARAGQREFYLGAELAGVILARGPNGAPNNGESQTWIRLHMGDLCDVTGDLGNVSTPNGSQPVCVYLREIPDCKTINGSPTPGFRLVLCSQFYETSLRGSTPDP